MDEKIDQILFGVDTVEQLRNNIEFNDFQLPHEVINEINKINFKKCEQTKLLLYYRLYFKRIQNKVSKWYCK